MVFAAGALGQGRSARHSSVGEIFSYTLAPWGPRSCIRRFSLYAQRQAGLVRGSWCRVA